MSAQRPDVGEGLAVGGIGVLAILCIFPVVWFLLRVLADVCWGRRMIDRWYRKHSAAHCRGRRAFAAEVRSTTERLATTIRMQAPERCQRLIETARRAMEPVEQAYELDRFLTWAPKRQGHPRVAGNEFVREQSGKVLRQADCLEYEGELKSKTVLREVQSFRQAIVNLGLDLAHSMCRGPGARGGRAPSWRYSVRVFCLCGSPARYCRSSWAENARPLSPERVVSIASEPFTRWQSDFPQPIPRNRVCACASLTTRNTSYASCANDFFTCRRSSWSSRLPYKRLGQISPRSRFNSGRRHQVQQVTAVIHRCRYVLSDLP
jgi:hypothetical protein